MWGSARSRPSHLVQAAISLLLCWCNRPPFSEQSLQAFNVLSARSRNTFVALWERRAVIRSYLSAYCSLTSMTIPCSCQPLQRRLTTWHQPNIPKTSSSRITYQKLFTQMPSSWNFPWCMKSISIGQKTQQRGRGMPYQPHKYPHKYIRPQL